MEEQPQQEADSAQPLPPTASKLLRPSRRVRLFVIPVMVFGFTALLVAIGIGRLKSDQQESHPQTAAPVPTSPKKQHEDGSNEPKTSLEDAAFEKLVTPAVPLKSFVLDAAQSYLATGSLLMRPRH